VMILAKRAQGAACLQLEERPFGKKEAPNLGRVMAPLTGDAGGAGHSARTGTSPHGTYPTTSLS
jgi:hypothetical protein